MKTKLLNNLSNTEKEDLKQNFVYSKIFRDRLKEVLEKDIEALYASMRNEEMFELPNWALVQADRVAQTKVLKKIISYLE